MPVSKTIKRAQELIKDSGFRPHRYTPTCDEFKRICDLHYHANYAICDKLYMNDDFDSIIYFDKKRLNDLSKHYRGHKTLKEYEGINYNEFHSMYWEMLQILVTMTSLSWTFDRNKNINTAKRIIETYELFKEKVKESEIFIMKMECIFMEIMILLRD